RYEAEAAGHVPLLASGTADEQRGGGPFGARRLIRVMRAGRAAECAASFLATTDGLLHTLSTPTPDWRPTSTRSGRSFRHRMGASETEQRPLAAKSAEADDTTATPTEGRQLRFRTRNRVAAVALIVGVGVLVLWLVLRDTSDHGTSGSASVAIASEQQLLD